MSVTRETSPLSLYQHHPLNRFVYMYVCIYTYFFHIYIYFYIYIHIYFFSTSPLVGILRRRQYLCQRINRSVSDRCGIIIRLVVWLTPSGVIWSAISDVILLVPSRNWFEYHCQSPSLMINQSINQITVNCPNSLPWIFTIVICKLYFLINHCTC